MAHKIHFLILFVLYLRIYATTYNYFACLNLFNTLHTDCVMHGLSIHEIKMICHDA